MRREDLHGYQERAVRFIEEHERCALFLDMGLGKTAVTLTAIGDLIARGEVSTVLVVTKKLIALHTWPEEAGKWEHLRGLRVVPLLGSSEARRARMGDGADIHTINAENVAWLFGEAIPGRLLPWDMIVLDESSLFKNGSAKRSRVMRSVCDRAGRVVALTGTPAPNGYMDLWGQFRLVDGGERLGRHITAYRSRYFYPAVSHGHITYKWGMQPHAEERIRAAVEEITLSMRAEDYLELPEAVVNDIPVELPAKAQKVYRQLKRDAVAELKGETITAANAAALSGKLLQAANGAVYTTEEGGWEELHRAKIERLQEIAECATSPLLVAYSYRHDRERILEALAAYAPQEATDPGVIEAWNAGKVPVLIGHPASVGHGLNLQAGGHTVVWFGLPWNREQYDQFNARLLRQGQRERVVIHRLIARGTLEERVARVLEAKGAVESELMEALRGELEEQKGAGRLSQRPGSEILKSNN